MLLQLLLLHAQTALSSPSAPVCTRTPALVDQMEDHLYLPSPLHAAQQTACCRAALIMVPRACTPSEYSTGGSS